MNNLDNENNAVSLLQQFHLFMSKRQCNMFARGFNIESPAEIPDVPKTIHLILPSEAFKDSLYKFKHKHWLMIAPILQMG